MLTQNRELYSGLIRLHVLHHATEEPVFGLGMLEELARHGYRITPGTLYPILHGLGKKAIFKQGDRIVRRATDEVREGSTLQARP